MGLDGFLAEPKRFPALLAAEKDKRRWLQVVAVAAGLFVAMQASPSAAVTPCQKLLAAIIAHGWFGHEDPVKPQDFYLNISNEGGLVIRTGWNVPSTRPEDTITGRCVHLTHDATGTSKEFCQDSTSTTAYISYTHCLGTDNCPAGNYTAKVKLKNDCNGATDQWSDTDTDDKE